jgi:hypothetical protein
MERARLMSEVSSRSTYQSQVIGDIRKRPERTSIAARNDAADAADGNFYVFLTPPMLV